MLACLLASHYERTTYPGQNIVQITVRDNKKYDAIYHDTLGPKTKNIHQKPSPTPQKVYWGHQIQQLNVLTTPQNVQKHGL